MTPPGASTVSSPKSDVPAGRVRRLHEHPPRGKGKYVLYWMIAQRRTQWNFALQRAVDWCRCLGKPLLVFEPLRCDYHWACDRFHQFVIEGMADNAKRLDRRGVTYFPYVEPERGADVGLLRALAKEAAVVVTDDYPAFFYPAMLPLAAKQVDICFEAVDSNGLLPMSASPKEFLRAVDFRRHLQKVLPEHLLGFPAEDPLRRVRLPDSACLPHATRRLWPPVAAKHLQNPASLLRELPIDHSIQAGPIRGGAPAAQKLLRAFLEGKLSRYENDSNHPDDDATSNLSPYLHFGHIAAHEIFAKVAATEKWNPGKLAKKANGRRQKWWGMSAAAESFVDQLVTWRELGFNMCAQRRDYTHYSSLPEWAKKTLQKHARDRREHVYTLEEFALAKTHDPVWNACQRQLREEGRLHNYMRMLWGKKILEWTTSPHEALRIMIELNNRYAFDGRDPNSYSGIFWVLGRYDRPWGPERPIFGRVRFMSSDNTRRKLRVTEYLKRYGK